MEKIILELKAGEGGMDSKLLVTEMAEIYKKTAQVENFSFKVLSQGDSFLKAYL